MKNSVYYLFCGFRRLSHLLKVNLKKILKKNGFSGLYGVLKNWLEAVLFMRRFLGLSTRGHHKECKSSKR